MPFCLIRDLKSNSESEEGDPVMLDLMVAVNVCSYCIGIANSKQIKRQRNKWTV